MQLFISLVNFIVQLIMIKSFLFQKLVFPEQCYTYWEIYQNNTMKHKFTNYFSSYGQYKSLPKSSEKLGK